MLSEGATLPNVPVLDDTGATVSTQSFLGSPLVLWFYPKDDTPG